MSFLNRFFKLNEYQTSVKTETLAGLTTFLTMAYILFANPAILGSAGMNQQGVFVATCLVSALGCFLISLLANYPIAIAPGMALNVYFSYTIVQSLGYSWQTALGAVFIAGVLFLIMSITNIRRLIIEAIPQNLAAAIAAGLGIFIALIALKSAGIIVSNPKTFISLGHVGNLSSLLFLLNFCFIVVLDHYQIKSALILGILVTTFLSILLKLSTFHGILALPPFDQTAWAAFNLHDLGNRQGIIIILTFLLVALLDSTGTLMGVLQHSGLLKDSKRMARLSGAFIAESLATVSGSLLGTSTTSLYIESASGIKAGGRTGLTAMTVGILFILALFFSPLAKTVPVYATSPVLLFISCLMIKNFVHLNWGDLSETIPSIIIGLMIPFTFSIAVGFGCGIITYIIIKLFCRDFKSLKNPILLLLGIIFVVYFIYS